MDTKDDHRRSQALLYYTDHSVKKNRPTLGYDDHAYFSRNLYRAEKISPLSYRKKYR